MKIGIIGIGMLGEAVALNLLNSGYDTFQFTIEQKKKQLKLKKKVQK